jgi:hypothetical protein
MVTTSAPGTNPATHAPAATQGKRATKVYDINKSAAFEIRCPSCGLGHPNPALCDSYRYCPNCSSVMREAASIDLTKFPPPKGRLLIIAAAYGHRTDASMAFDVRDILQRRVEAYGAKDALKITSVDHLMLDIFKELSETPCPGVLKSLRVRFYIEGRRSEMVAYEDKEFHLAEPGLMILVPKKPPTLILHSCSYGHPRGIIKGRGAFDVTEVLQARVEESGGTFLELGHDENLKDLFGDPCPNRRKNLIINYEIHGSSGKLTAEEVEGHLKKTIDLSYTPVIAPLIVIDKATYGLTPEGISDKIRDIQIELYSLTAIENRKKLGLPISAEDNARLVNDNGGMRLPHLAKKLVAAEALTGGFVDVSHIVQQRVESCGGGKLDFSMTEDLNELFGSNPNPGNPKQLRISFTVLGHDSERMTLSNEITYPSGFPRNFIMPRNDNVVFEATEDPSGKYAHLIDPIYVVCPKVLTTLEITQGFYGKLSNYRKVFDVTAELRQLSFLQGGHKLYISNTDDLESLFRDPARGVRKELKLSYTSRGFSGTMRIEESKNFLKSSIQIGYIPEKGSNGANRRESRKMSLRNAAGGVAAAMNMIKVNKEKRRKGTIVVGNSEPLPEFGEGSLLTTVEGDEGEEEDGDDLEEEVTHESGSGNEYNSDVVDAIVNGMGVIEEGSISGSRDRSVS